MILVVGGVGSGKRAYVRGLGYGDDDMAAGLDTARPVVLDLHEILRDDAVRPDAALPVLLGKEVVVCAEVGCGIVPVSEAERAWRDRVGRTCILLARDASRVVRLCCGIPIIIKDT